MTRKYRPRQEFKFQLYKDIEEQIRLIEYVNHLRKTKHFVTAVRNGLRLLWSLGEGDLSVLFELFPTLQAQLTPKNNSLIEEFRALLKEQQPVVMMAPVSAVPTLSAEIGPLQGVKQIAMPTFDDDDQDTLDIRVDTKNTSAANFFKAAFGNQQEKGN